MADDLSSGDPDCGITVSESSRKKPGLAFWATVVVVALGLYVASFGPVVRLMKCESFPDWAYEPLALLYTPVWPLFYRQDAVGDFARWYVGLFFGEW